MTTNPPAYMPAQGSLAERVTAFFLRNPDDELSRGDVALKFEVHVNDVARLLKPLLDDNTLVLSRPEGKGIARNYSAGLALREAAKKQGSLDLDKPANAARPAPVPTLAKPPTKRSPQVPVTMAEMEALQVDDHVPPNIRSARFGGMRKWATLFAKLKKQGQSVEFPAAWKTAVAAEAQKINRENRKLGQTARYSVANTQPGKARAWRIA